MNNFSNNEYQVLLTRRMPASSAGEAACRRATVLGLPEVVAEACSREQALAGIEQRLAELLRQSEIVTIRIPEAAQNGASEMEALGYRHFGVFANDPDALKLFDEIEEARNLHLVEPVEPIIELCQV